MKSRNRGELNGHRNERERKVSEDHGEEKIRGHPEREEEGRKEKEDDDHEDDDNDEEEEEGKEEEEEDQATRSHEVSR